LAGVSNVNLTGSWADQEGITLSGRAMVLDYFRISPAGPLAPLVFTLTTIRDRLSLCTTYRTTAFSQNQAEQIATELMERLQHFEYNSGERICLLCWRFRPALVDFT